MAAPAARVGGASR